MCVKVTALHVHAALLMALLLFYARDSSDPFIVLEHNLSRMCSCSLLLFNPVESKKAPGPEDVLNIKNASTCTKECE